MTNKRLSSILLLIGLPFSKGVAQANLVPNASFEAIAQCPDYEGQISRADFWFSVTQSGTPDLYNVCATDEAMGVPNNGNGGLSHQPAKSGNGYAGIFVYSHNSNVDTREYIEVSLTTGLKLNKQYYLNFFVSPSVSRTDDAPCFCDGIGAAFTQNKFVSAISGLHALSDMQPVVDKMGEVISDTLNWIPVSGCFTNTGSEKSHLIIGNFRDNANTIPGPGCDLSFLNSSYLYVDDVGVWEFDPLPDTILLCDGTSKSFHFSFLNAHCKWSDGSSDTSFVFSQQGIYSVSADMGGCILSDTTVVIDQRKQPKMPADTLICLGEKVTLSAPVPGNYEWSTGEHSHSINAFQAATYSLSVTNECGVYYYESRIETERCDCPIYVPNVFSPNGDGQNDDFLVFAACDFPYHIDRFQIFDRWGSLVYSSTGHLTEGIQWDGMIQNARAAAGVYTWIMEYDIFPAGRQERKNAQGDISVFR